MVPVWLAPARGSTFPKRPACTCVASSSTWQYSPKTPSLTRPELWIPYIAVQSQKPSLIRPELRIQHMAVQSHSPATYLPNSGSRTWQYSPKSPAGYLPSCGPSLCNIPQQIQYNHTRSKTLCFSKFCCSDIGFRDYFTGPHETYAVAGPGSVKESKTEPPLAARASTRRAPEPALRRRYARWAGIEME